MHQVASHSYVGQQEIQLGEDSHVTQVVWHGLLWSDQLLEGLDS